MMAIGNYTNIARSKLRRRYNMLFLVFIAGTIFGIISMGIISEQVENKIRLPQ